MVLNLADSVNDFVGRVHSRYLLGRRNRRPRKLPLESLRVSFSNRESRAGAESAFDVVCLRSWSHWNCLIPTPAWYGEVRDGRAVHFDIWIISSWPWIVKYDECHDEIGHKALTVFSTVY